MNVSRLLAAGRSPYLLGFLSSLSGSFGRYGYWAVLLLVMTEDLGVPVPGEIILIAVSV